MTDSQDPQLERRLGNAGELLRAAEHEIEPEVTQRLLAARREAVALADERRSSPLRWPLGLASGGAMAAVAILGLTVMLRTPQFDELPRLDDVELAAAQEVELLEDLEFVAWMIALENENSATSG